MAAQAVSKGLEQGAGSSLAAGLLRSRPWLVALLCAAAMHAGLLGELDSLFLRYPVAPQPVPPSRAWVELLPTPVPLMADKLSLLSSAQGPQGQTAQSEQLAEVAESPMATLAQKPAAQAVERGASVAPQNPAVTTEPQRAPQAAQTDPSPATVDSATKLAAQEADSPIDPDAIAPDAAALRSVPVYPVALPEPFVMPLKVQRPLSPSRARRQLAGATPRPAPDGAEAQTLVQGQGELRLERDAQGRYAMNLSLRWAGRSWLDMNSRGLLGPAGLEPERFTDRRQSRGSAAANFDRAAGQARFSGGSAPVALARAVQDRASWLVQLPAMVQADSALRRHGAQVLIQVVGARGGSQVWRFEATGPHTQALPDGQLVDGLWHWRREAEQPYDIQVDVWLDPQQQHLPAWVRLTPVPGGAPLDFWRASAPAGSEHRAPGP